MSDNRNLSSSAIGKKKKKKKAVSTAASPAIKGTRESQFVGTISVVNPSAAPKTTETKKPQTKKVKMIMRNGRMVPAGETAAQAKARGEAIQAEMKAKRKAALAKKAAELAKKKEQDYFSDLK